jgi:SAM-dependent methyltransferase
MAVWEEFYKSGEFSINTKKPSSLVVEFEEQILPESRVADIGCGAGRNAVYLASRGYQISASDIVDLGWHSQLNETLRSKIDFEVTDTSNLSLQEEAFGGALMMRLLQYLSPEELSLLTQRVNSCLLVGGIAVASYVVSGGKDKSRFGIQQYNHTPEDIVELWQDSGLEVIENRNFSTVSQHIPYHSEVEVCELVARKPFSRLPAI